MSNRSKSFKDLLGDTKGGKGTGPSDEEQPKAPPTTVMMHTITGNPENPRQPDDYTDDDAEFVELKESMRSVGQLQPVAVMSRALYASKKPEHTQAVEDADWVVIGGNRRLAAARRLGWTRIDVRVQDRLAEEDQIDDAVIIENIHRKKLDPMREAEFLSRMVDKHGSQDEVARRIGKSQMYVSHRLELLKLDPQVQQALEGGEVKPAQVRGLAKKAPEEQLERVEQIKAAKQAPKPRKAQSQNAVLKQTEAPAPERSISQGHQADAGAAQNDVLKPTPSPAGESLPEQRAEPATPPPGPQWKRFPYDDGPEVGRLLVERMEPGEYTAASRVVAEQAWDKVGVEPSVDLTRRMVNLCLERSPEHLLAIVGELVEGDEGFRKLLQSKVG